MIIPANILVAINSIVDGEKIKGIRLNLPSSEISINDTIEEMVALEILTAEHHLSIGGEVVVRMIKKYKESTKIICINSMRICLCEDDMCIVIIPYYDIHDYLINIEMKYVKKAAILAALLIDYPPLKNGTKRYSINRVEKMEQNQICNIINSIPTDKALFYAVISNEDVQSFVCLIDTKNTIKVNLSKKTKEESEAGNIRRELALLLESD